MVYRIYVEKKEELAHEAKSLYNEARNLLGIRNLEKVRVINRYDAEKIESELFEYADKNCLDSSKFAQIFNILSKPLILKTL